MAIDVIILVLVLLLVIADWRRIRRSLIRLRSGEWRVAGVPKKGVLWLFPAPARIVPHEGIAIVGGAAVVILILALPAFSGFFIAEDFTYLGNYQSAGNRFLAGILTPIGHIFFRPSAAAWYLMFYDFLPVEPWAHHLRNWLTTALAAGLLYALSRRLVASPMARAMGVAFFAISKVHLTTIGYINCNDSIMSLIQIEATLYLLILYFQSDRPLFLYLSYIPFTLEVFSRDYGMAILAMVGTALLVHSRHVEAPWKFVVRRFAPFAGIAGIYFCIRLMVLRGEAIGRSPSYHLAFGAEAIAYRAWLFAGNLFNVSLGQAEVTGRGSFAIVLQELFPGIVQKTRPWDAGFVLLASILIFVMTLGALRKDQRLWIPLVWGAAFIGPTFLIANVQMYYILEPLGAVSLLLAMLPGSLRGRYWTHAAVAILSVAAINAAIESRFINIYSWRFCANAAGRTYDEAIRPHLGQSLRSWTLLVPEERQLDFWAYTLTANGSCPMIPALLRLPHLQVNVMKARAVTPEELNASDTPVYLVSNDHLLRLRRPSIDGLIPESTRLNTKFNVQPDGNVAIWVNCENALPTSVVLWNGEPLATSFGSTRGLSALIPPRLLSTPGAANVSIRDRQTGLESATYPFRITTGKPQNTLPAMR